MGGRPSAKLRVHVQPGARQTQLVGLVEGVLRVKLAAPPVEGRANEALIALLSDLLQVAKGRVTIARGHSSRDKVLIIEGIGEDELSAKLLEVQRR